MRNRYTPLIIIIAVLAFFALFIWGITRPSEYGIASDKISSSSNFEDLKLIWADYKEHIIEDEDLKKSFESKVLDLNLSKLEEDDLARWYPIRTHLNVVIVPDLSNRIINIPDQTKFDTTVISHIWKCFQNEVKHKYKPGELMMDKLTVDVMEMLLRESLEKLRIH